jgi:hypothetical protein
VANSKQFSLLVLCSNSVAVDYFTGLLDLAACTFLFFTIAFYFMGTSFEKKESTWSSFIGLRVINIFSLVTLIRVTVSLCIETTLFVEIPVLRQEHFLSYSSSFSQ